MGTTAHCMQRSSYVAGLGLWVYEMYSNALICWRRPNQDNEYAELIFSHYLKVLVHV